MKPILLEYHSNKVVLRQFIEVKNCPILLNFLKLFFVVFPLGLSSGERSLYCSILGLELSFLNSSREESSSEHSLRSNFSLLLIDVIQPPRDLFNGGFTKGSSSTIRCGSKILSYLQVLQVEIDYCIALLQVRTVP